MLYFNAVHMSSTSLAYKSEPYTTTTSLSPKSKADVVFQCHSHVLHLPRMQTASRTPPPPPLLSRRWIYVIFQCRSHALHLPRMQQQDGGGSLSPSANHCPRKAARLCQLTLALPLRGCLVSFGAIPARGFVCPRVS
jgi:hypothetical protein